MNIWILNHYAIPPNSAGGTRHFDLAKRWSEKGHQVTIFSSNFDYMERIVAQRVAKCTSEFVDPVMFIRVKTRPYSKNDIHRLLGMVDYAINVLRCPDGIEKPDIIIGSMVHHFAVVASYQLSRKYRVPFIIEVRDLWPETLVEMGAFSDYHPFVVLLKMLNKFLFPRASHIVSVPPFAHERIMHYGVPKERITHLPNFVDIERFSSSESEAKYKDDLFIVMYAGLHGPSNGLDVVLKAAYILQQKKVMDVRFWLVGDGPEKPALIRLSQTLGLRNVEFYQPMPKDRIGELMQKASAFVFHQRDLPVLVNYGISANKLFDYMAVGRPIIFACRSRNDPVTESGGGIAIPPENPQAMANAILRLFHMSQDELKQMGNNARQYVIQNYSADIVAEKYLDLIERIAAHDGSN